jgi:hypothetical protein
MVLNEQPLPFSRAPNPHRRGAALVAMATLLERMAIEHNTLRIDIG